MTEDAPATPADRKAARDAATAKRKAERAAAHERYKVEAAARRAAERTRQKEQAAARTAARRATRAANGERARTVRAQRAHDSIMRRVFGLRRDLTSAPCETDDGLPFVSIEVGTDPAALDLFVLQRDVASGKQVVVASRTGAVVARGATREAALRAFAKTLPAVVVMPRMGTAAWGTAWRAHLSRRRAWQVADAARESRNRR